MGVFRFLVPLLVGVGVMRGAARQCERECHGKLQLWLSAKRLGLKLFGRGFMDVSTESEAYYECYCFAVVVVLDGVRLLRCCSPANLFSQPQQQFAAILPMVVFASKKGRCGNFH
jgi:hypothetical protein